MNDNKDFLMIQKREYNPQLSVFSNFVLDLVDFKDRVVPLASDISLMDVSQRYQKTNINTVLSELDEFKNELKEAREEYHSQQLEERENARQLEENRRQ